jgi:predicted nucleic acid-binding Zn ribbon protein
MFKSCIHCSKEFQAKDNRKKFCSQSCSASHAQLGKPSHNQKKPRNLCYCGSPIENPVSVFCSDQCRQSQKMGGITEWVQGGPAPLGPESITRWVKKLRGSACEECGWDQQNPVSGRSQTQVDHIDGDSTNLMYTNLKVLCPNCHSMTPTFGSLNRGKGTRTKRFSNLVLLPRICPTCGDSFTPISKRHTSCSRKCRGKATYQKQISRSS